MCLGVPGEIVQIEGKLAKVDFWGTRKTVRLDLLEEVVLPGDYIIDHAGYAVRRIDPERVAETLALYETILGEAGEDPIARAFVEELESANELELV